MVLIIKHIDIEGPGTLEDFFKQNNWQIKVVDLGNNDSLPPLRECEAVISLGGPMNVYETDKYPFLKTEEDFLRAALKQEKPILGICLGAQMLAKTCGAKVKKAKQKEIGWYEVDLNDVAKTDILFQGIEDNLTVFQWHEDVFDIPKEGILLAKTKDINQAFRIGNAYGLQFHLEVTPKMIKDWIDYYIPNPQRKYQSLLTKYDQVKSKFESQRDMVFQNFLPFILPKN